MTCADNVLSGVGSEPSVPRQYDMNGTDKKSVISSGFERATFPEPSIFSLKKVVFLRRWPLKKYP